MALATIAPDYQAIDRGKFHYFLSRVGFPTE
jgi:hypothetical protein